jgi:catechol 2,3-dioxygenase-like lactoylglutathione lyase family enzyme
MSDGVAFNHIGLCVTDVERSRAFYEGALGFRSWWEFDAPDQATEKLLGLSPPLGLHAAYMVRDGLVLELLHYSQGEHPRPRPRAMDEPGLTHISVAVQDIPAALERVRQLGGEVLEQTDVGAGIMVHDPDGQLVELTTWDWVSRLPPRP